MERVRAKRNSYDEAFNELSEEEEEEKVGSVARVTVSVGLLGLLLVWGCWVGLLGLLLVWGCWVGLLGGVARVTVSVGLLGLLGLLLVWCYC